MIWRRLKKSTPEEEQQFREQMQEVNPSRKDKFAMVLSAYLVLVIPALVVLILFALLILWIF